METPTPGKGEDRFDKPPAMRGYQRQAGVQISAVENNQRPARSCGAAKIDAIKTASKPRTVKGNMVQAKGFASPTKQGSKKVARLLRICRSKLDIVDLVKDSDWIG